jgi:hypothetical protein
MLKKGQGFQEASAIRRQLSGTKNPLTKRALSFSQSKTRMKKTITELWNQWP